MERFRHLKVEGLLNGLLKVFLLLVHQFVFFGRPTAGESVGRVRKVREKKEKRREGSEDEEEEDDKAWETVHRNRAGGEVMEEKGCGVWQGMGCGKEWGGARDEVGQGKGCGKTHLKKKFPSIL